MSSSVSVIHRYVMEQSFGVLPATPAFKRLAGIVSFNKGSSPEHSRPSLKRGDFMPGKLRRTRQSSAPALDVALIYGDLDDFFEGAMRSQWQTDTPGVGSDTLTPGDPATGYFPTFSHEEEFTDEPTQELAKTPGTAVAGYSLSFPLDGEVTGSIPFIGKIPVSIPASEADSTGSPVTGEVMAGLDVANVQIDGGSYDGCIQQIDLDFQSPVAGRWCLGAGLDAQSIRYDPFALNVSLGLYNSPEGHALWKKMVDPALPVISLVFDCVDAVSGSKYEFTMADLRAVAGDHDWSAEDVVIPLELEANDPGTGELIKIVRTP